MEKSEAINTIKLKKKGREWMNRNIEKLRKNFSGKHIMVRKSDKEDWQIVFALTDMDVLENTIERTTLDRKKLVSRYVEPYDCILVPTSFSQVTAGKL